MKRIIILCFAIIGLCCYAMALPVDQETAKAIASKFMVTNNVQLSTTYTTDSNVAAFYVFNTNDGFVIISADDCETPIIGYSREGRFDPNDVPIQMEDYLQDFVARIQYGIENHIESDEVTTRQWELVKTIGRLKEQKKAKSVGPLLTDHWHQGCFYNSQCPEKSGPCGHAEVGCVAVAMGQIMHYWGYPSTGWGANSYTNFGVELSADFGNTVYEWEHMPDSLTENSTDAEIEAVATLLYHCGISVNMTYSNNGSTAGASDIPYALLRYFKYSRAIHRESQNDYSNEEWLAMIKNNLDLQRPVQYTAYGSGAHAFVCDGYDDNDLLHFNWGWGGNGDGYYAIGHLNPIGYHFNYNNAVILDIIPEYEPCHVVPTVYPPTTGSVAGGGNYHYGESCTLTAVPAEHCEFYCWKRNGQIITFNPTYTIDLVEDDIEDIEANFTLEMPQLITAIHYPDANNPESPAISLSWELQDPNDWVLLKEFDIGQNEDGVGTDGEYIYTSSSYSWAPLQFGKYNMDGDSLETFTIEGCEHSPVLAFDGNYFYYIGATRRLQCVDFVHKTLVSSVNVNESIFTLCVIDSVNNGFWISYYNSAGQTKRLKLIDHNGQTLREGPLLSPTIPYNSSPYGSCYIVAKDGTQHLLFSSQGRLYDYNITNDLLNDYQIMDFHYNFKGACIGTYDEKEALFIIYSSKVHIYEINHHLSQIVGYCIYRSDANGNTVKLADRMTGISFIDNSWTQTFSGTYRFGISSVFSNGNESEIVWSDPIESVFDAIEENDGSTEQSIQKVIENGQIIIIKDGKRYNITGQRLN